MPYIAIQKRIFMGMKTFSETRPRKVMKSYIIALRPARIEPMHVHAGIEFSQSAQTDAVHF